MSSSREAAEAIDAHEALAPKETSDAHGALETGWQGTSRYRIVRKLGAGGMGIVYEALDRENARPVALKTLLHVDPSGLYAFKQEFRTLADVQHRNLVHLYELVVSDGHPTFFTMELVQGTDFIEYTNGASRSPGESTTGFTLSGPITIHQPLASASGPVESGRMVAASPKGGVNLDRLRPALRQLVEGLQALHGAGKVHRDIKPSNVLVTPEGRVVLLDFGVAADVRGKPGEASTEGELVGTPVYMSPEQAAGEVVTPASDWYSVGVILFEALVGRPPFEGPTAVVLTQKLSAEAPAPSECIEGVPRDLDHLCSALLRIEPSERPSGSGILRELGATGSSASHASPHTSSTPPPPLVGRKAPLKALHDAFDEVRGGRAVAVRVHGRGGTGKTALVDHFVGDLLAGGQSNALVGRVYERESVPYKAFDGVMDALSRQLVQQEEDEGRLALPVAAWALAALFPVLKRVRSIEGLRVRPITDAQHTRRRAFEALRELIGSLARRRPLVVFIDDVQWGDVDSVALLQELARQPGGPPFLLVMTYRDEDAETSPFLREMNSRWQEPIFELTEMRDVVVEALDTANARQLALALLDADERGAHQTARSIAEESGGNPELIEELARGHRDRDSNDRAVFGHLTLDAMISERLDQLPAEARRLVEVVATAGRPMPVATVADAAGERDGIEERVTLLVTQRFVRTGFRDGRDMIEPVHSRVREIVLSRTSPDRVREHHGRLAALLEAQPQTNLEAVSSHLLGAGEPARAAALAERAADEATAKLAFEHAARLLRQALETHERRGNAGEVQRLRVRTAQALTAAGRPTEAGDMYLLAAAHVSGIERVDLEREGGYLLMAAGQIDRGKAVLLKVLASVNVRAPRSVWSGFFWFIVYRIWLTLRGFRFRDREPDAVSREDRIRIGAVYAISSAVGLIDIVLGSCMTVRVLLLSLDRGDRYQVGLSLGGQLIQYASERRREPRKQELVARQAFHGLASSIGQSAEPFVHVIQGLSDYQRGSFGTALTHLDSARTMRTARSAGDAHTDLFACFACAGLGRMREARRRGLRLLREADDRGDLYTSVTVRLAALVTDRLVADDPDAARRMVRQAIAQWSQSGFFIQHWYALLREMEIAQYTGQPEAGCELFERERRALRKSFVLFSPSVALMSNVTAGRCYLDAAVRGAATRREARLADVRDVLRRIEHHACSPGPTFSALLRAGLASAEGYRSYAIAHLREALAQSEASELGGVSATIRYRLGTVLHDDEGRALRAQAEEALRAQGVRNIARWTAIGAPGRWDEKVPATAT